MDSFTSHNSPITTSKIPPKSFPPDRSCRSPYSKSIPPADASRSAEDPDPPTLIRFTEYSPSESQQTPPLHRCRHQIDTP